MAALRAFCLFSALVGFFLLGAPLQWLVARHVPRAAHLIPLFFCRSLLRMLKVRLEVEGTRVGSGPVIFVANHVSWIDILALGAITPFCFLAKREVGAWPILSAFAEVQGTVFVDRQRRRSIPGANRQMARQMGRGRPVLLFPEGTTGGAPEPGPFRTSHFAAARDFLVEDRSAGSVLVQPVAIAYSSSAAAWIGDDALLPHLWRTLRAAPLQCAVTFATPVSYERNSDRKAVAQEARASIVAVLAQNRGRERSAQPAPAGAPCGEAAPIDFAEAAQ